MNPDEFEEKLQSQPLRTAPAQWRSEILRQAHASLPIAAQQQKPPENQNQRPFALASSGGWREWFWPCPQAWGALALIWMILLGMHIADRSASASLIAQTSPPSPEIRTALAAQRREMTRLLDGTTEPASIPKRSVPGPRSERISPSKA